MLYNGGAYGAAKVTPNLLQGVGFATIPYFIPHVRLALKNAYTNTVPSAATAMWLQDTTGSSIPACRSRRRFAIRDFA